MHIKTWHAKPRYLVLVLVPLVLPAQEKTDLQQILERMERLEQENRNLAAEVRALRDEIAVTHPAPPGVNPAGVNPATRKPSSAGDLATATGSSPAPPPPIEERVAVEERRTEELAQTKVQTSQRLPVTLTGMVLFNGFLNSRANGGQQDPTQASPSNNASDSGASLSQSIIGLAFQGPRIFGDGQVTGDLHMDLSGGTSNSLDHLVRLRVATLRIDWKNQSIIVGQDKPIISPRDPSSLAQVAVSPLTAAGNPWLLAAAGAFRAALHLGRRYGIARASRRI